MTNYVPGVPAPNEYNPAFAGYIQKAESWPDPVSALEQQSQELLSLLRPLDETKQLHRYAPGKWSVKDVLGHIIDAERIFSYRALRIARADQTPLPIFDENAYAAAAGSDQWAWNERLEEFEHVRGATVLLFRHLPEAAWLRTATVSGGPMSVRALAYITLGHAGHHMAILRERYL